MHAALGYYFLIEVSEFLDEMDVVQKQSRSPAEREFWLSATGISLAVVSMFASLTLFSFRSSPAAGRKNSEAAR
ncbi:hypothetical protein GCM10027514_20130 [Azotobacter armeniacus]